MATFKIGEREIGGDNPCLIIAEGGINHQGDVNLAKKLITLAKKSGCDIVKFQKRDIPSNFTTKALAAPYNSKNAFAATYGEHKKVLELSKEDWLEMKAHAKEEGIMLTASAMDHKSADFLDDIGVDVYKIGSGDFYNIPLLRHVAKKGKPIIFSTGMADSLESVQKVYQEVKALNPNVAILNCTSTYPSPPEDTHLAVLNLYQKTFPDAVIGYSGHEMGTEITLGAVALGAKIVERHITLNPTWKGSDHIASLDPVQLHDLVRSIRIVEKAIGKPIKQRRESEDPVFAKAGKSVVAGQDLKSGTVLTEEHLAVKASNPKGAAPTAWDDMIGKTITKDVPFDEPVTLDMLK